MHDFIQVELAKGLDALAKTSPASEEYSRILGGIHNVYSMAGVLEECIAIVTPEVKDNVIAFPKEVIPEREDLVPTEEELAEIAELNEVDEESPFETTSEEVKKEYTMAEVRQALVDARMQKGFDSSSFLRSFGVTSLTALPSSRYNELMDKLKESV